MIETAIFVARAAGGGFCVAFGLVLMLGGVIGVLRFPDLYTRLHAARTDAIGLAICLFGLAIVWGDWAGFVRLALLSALVGVLGPTTTQLVANAAHVGGLAPLAGRYRAPRPGVKREPAP